MKSFATIAILASALAACDRASTADTTQTTGATTTAPDNTKTNSRDNARAVTPLEQGNGKADLETTQTIRKALMADDTLSSNAKNVKIITNNGVITLRGPVKTAEEKQSVEAKAMSAAGVNRVDDLVDVQNN